MPLDQLDGYDGSLDGEIQAVLAENSRTATQRLHDVQWRKRFEAEAARRGLELPD